jgi:hypothetical protein
VAVNFTTLFTRLGHFLYVGEGITAALGTTTPTRVNAAITGLGSSLPVEYETVRDQLLTGLQGFQGGGSTGLGNLVQTPVEELILLTVSDDQPIASTLDLAVAELIKQMEDNSQSLDASTVSASVAYDGGNVGNGVVVSSVKRGDGKFCLFAFAEDLDIAVNSIANGDVTFTITGEPLIDSLAPTWPGGSGASETTTGKTASSSDNKVTNGTFEDNDDNSVNLPLGWLAPVATLGTTLKMGSVEVQTITITGTPTSGFYVLNWSNGAGQSQTTAPLAFNAGESDVQSALQALAGLSAVTVSTSGTSPNYVHTVTFTGVTNPAQLTSTSSLAGGSPSIAHATTTAASANVFRGSRAVEFASNGSQLTTIMVPVSLAALTQYAACVWVKASSAAPAAGVLTVDLVDGVGGTVINDAAGTDNSYTIGHASLTSSFQAFTGVFRMPAAPPAQAYLRIRISTAVTNTVSVYLDEVYLGEMTEAYVDGPSVIVFNGGTDWLAGDLATVTVTNDRAGLIHEWLNRLLGLRGERLLFPTVTDTSETQADSLVA